MPFSPQQAIDAVKKFIKDLPFDTDPPKLRVLNDAQGLIWSYAPWRWTVDVLAATDIANDTATVAVAGAASFERIVLAYLQLATGDVQELIPAAVLSTQTELKGTPKRISANSAGSTYTLQPTPTGYSPVPKLVVIYKKSPTEITAGNVSTTTLLGIPDAWFPVYVAAVLYYAYLYADDPRAGGAQAGAGGAVYTGQLGTVMALLGEMRSRELMPTDVLGQEKMDG